MTLTLEQFFRFADCAKCGSPFERKGKNSYCPPCRSAYDRAWRAEKRDGADRGRWLVRSVWQAMRQRCSNPKHNHYASYGGRGIRVCERWNVFEAFLADMGPRPSPAHSIDRIDNDGNYEPENCRWATSREQSRNSSRTVLTEAQVAQIKARLASGATRTDLAKMLNVKRGLICDIDLGRTWADVAAQSEGDFHQ